MIHFDRVSFTYSGATEPVFAGVDFEIPEGELCVVLGPTGSGKSTFLGLINGLVPHFSGGRLNGTVSVAGRSTEDNAPRELADVVGYVSQEPLAGFVTDTVEEELAYSMEQLAIAPDVMRKRVEETLDLLGIAELRDRSLRSLSGGQQQRVAIGAALTAHPAVLVLDEPTSALDPTAAEDVLSAIARLCHDIGTTVVLAEHRLERVVQFADLIISVGGGTVRVGPPADILRDSSVAPPIVELGRIANWDPLPLSVRDARRSAASLRSQLATSHPGGWRDTAADPVVVEAEVTPALEAKGITVRYGTAVAVADQSLELHGGSITALMGRNGSGKSSLMWAIQGSGKRESGRVLVAGADCSDLSRSDARKAVGLVPQTPSDLLYRTTIAGECAQADKEADVQAGTVASLVAELIGKVDHESHPRDLSVGQQLGLVLAIQLAAKPSVILLDEPTRGLDYSAKERLGGILKDLANDGTAVLLATHDVEFVAQICNRVVVIAQGEIVADGPTDEIVTSSPTFAPQVSKILAPEVWLTSAQVSSALSQRVDGESS